jgi:hypothetical protein
VATAYEVRVPVRPTRSATSVGEVLGRALADAGGFTHAPRVEPAGDDPNRLIVTLPLDAADSSAAALAGRDAVARALRVA